MTIEDFIQQLKLPAQGRVDKKVFKRLFYEHGDLKSADKKLFSDDVAEITILYTLTPETIPIQAYQDDDRVYDEIAIMHVSLRRIKPAERIAKVIQKSIPYPLVIMFSCEQQMQFNLADKRLNKADSSKLVMESMLFSPWLDLQSQAEFAKPFIQSFDICQLRYGNLYQFYHDWMQAILNLNASQYVTKNVRDVHDNYDLKRHALENIETRNEKISELRRKIKAAGQLNEKTRLNLQIKSLQDDIEQLKQQL